VGRFHQRRSESFGNCREGFELHLCFSSFAISPPDKEEQLEAQERERNQGEDPEASSSLAAAPRKPWPTERRKMKGSCWELSRRRWQHELPGPETIFYYFQFGRLR
jgi:hypothetical protein